MLLTGAYQNQIFKEPLGEEEESFHIKEMIELQNQAYDLRLEAVEYEVEIFTDLDSLSFTVTGIFVVSPSFKSGNSSFLTFLYKVSLKSLTK